MHGATDAYVMMEVLVGGQCDPRALARLAKGRARTKTAQLEEALREFFTEHHAAVLRMMLDNTDRIAPRSPHSMPASRSRSALLGRGGPAG